MGLGPAHAIERDDTGLALLADGAAEFAARLETDPRRLVGRLQHHGHPPRRNIAQRFDVDELDAPVAGDVQLGRGAAPAARFVIFDETGDHGLARHHLHLRVKRGPNRQSAFVQLLFAVALENVAPDFLGEILAGEDMRAVAAAGDVERFLARLVGVGLLDPAVFQQAIDHVVAPLDRAVAVANRVQHRGCLGQRRQIGGFRDREFVHGFVEIDQRCGRDAVGAETEIDFVEIELEDAVLRIGALDAHRQQGFLDLARERHFVGQKKVLRDLLGDRRGALRTPVGAEVLRIHHGRARHAGEVDAAMLVEVLVLGRQERVDDELRHRLDRQIEAALLGILAHQRTVGRMDARHHRRLVILKLRVVGQVLGEMPDRARDTGHADEEHDGPGGEQETQKPDQKAHYRSSVPTLCAEICGVYPNTAIPPNGLPPRGRTIKGPADNIDRFRRPTVDFLYRCRCGQTRAWAP